MLAAMPPLKDLGYFTERAGEMLSLVSELVRLDTPTGDREALERFAARYGALLTESGACCRLFSGPAGPSMMATYPGPEAPPLLLVGHSDTVWGAGESARRPPETRDGRLYGPGVYDMKAGLALVVFLFRY